MQISRHELNKIDHLVKLSLIVVSIVIETRLRCIVCKYFRTDKDECSTDEHNCNSVNACVNTIGSFTCSCSEEEIQDGDSCIGMSRPLFCSC